MEEKNQTRTFCHSKNTRQTLNESIMSIKIYAGKPSIAVSDFTKNIFPACWSLV